MRRRSTTVIVCLVLALVTAACGGGGDDATDALDSGTESDGGDGGGEDGAGDNVRRVLFVPAGPRDDSTPRGNQWYEFLTDGKCEALRDDAEEANPNDPPVILYRAAAAACTGEPGAAQQDLNRYLALGIPIDAQDCGRAFVIEFVQNVLRAAEADPNASITFAKSGRRPPCEENDDEENDDVTTTSGVRRTTTTRADTTE